MEIIDVHCHYEDKRFDEDRENILSSLPEKGIKVVIDAGCSITDSRFAQNLAEKFDNVFFCAGIHPENADELSQENIETLKSMWNDKKCVAVGEIGLDYHWDDAPDRRLQQKAFVTQLACAKEVNKPAVIHTRDAIADMLEILKRENVTNGLMHCFSESRDTARACLDMGLYFSFGGVCTFKNAVRANENLKYIPKEKILLETDSPYLAPEPVRGTRNDSLNLVYVCEHIAMLWNMTPAEVAEITTKNAKRFFGL